MQQRLNFRTVAPDALKTMLAIESYVAKCGLESKLLQLIRMRASQINGCAFCLDMHSKDARAEGETEQRLYALDAWRETPFYAARERAALAWTEALTLIADNHPPDEVYREVRAQFSERELADLTLAIAAINSWNRMAIGFRAEPGSYRPAAHARQAPASAAA